MAIGLGHMFGFTHPENFRYPYISRSATEFWRRWHITLGSFFRDYLYIPLGGNRRHLVRNLLITWFATGLWHGASWNFVVWGLYYGLLILVEKAFLEKLLNKLPRIISHFYLLVAMLVGWVFFNFENISDAFCFVGRMFFVGGAAADLAVKLDIVGNILWLIAAVLFCMPVTQLLSDIWSSVPQRIQIRFVWIRPVFNVALLVVCTALLVGQSYNPFLYFRF